MPLQTPAKRFRRAGFTLVELLVVIAIGAIVATLSITSYSKVLSSGALTTTTQAVIGLLDQSRQTAVAQNAFVEVRFYELPPATSSPTASPSVYRAMQAFLITNSGYTPLGKPVFFTTPMIIQTTQLTHSSLLDASKDASLIARTPSGWGVVTPPIGTAPTLPTYGNNYVAVTIRFSPKGSLLLDTTQQWFFTIISSSDQIIAATGLPANYSVLQIDGFTGKTTYYRP